MKLYYTQPERICGSIDRLFVIYVDGGLCWDEWQSISDLCHMAGHSKTEFGIRSSLYDYMEWLTIPTEFSHNGHAGDYFREADDDYKYSESELFIRHPDAKLFDKSKSICLSLPTEN